MAVSVRERARAKVNLTLTVRGRRPDGYHELDSLVAFAGVGDDVEVIPGGDFRLVVDGPFADAIAGENLAGRALASALVAEPRLATGAIRITKLLPVAAGLGGGSADAAAVLRAVARANSDLADGIDWNALARSLGADVAVCLANRPAMMRGFGDVIAPLPRFPDLPAVLVNPRVPVPADKTAAVFKALAAEPLSRDFSADTSVPIFDGAEDVLSYVAARANDLQAPARRVMPVVTDVLDALGRLPAARVVRLSGAGPTAFALFSAPDDAAAAAAELSRQHPGWWIVATTVGDGLVVPGRRSEL